MDRLEDKVWQNLLGGQIVIAEGTLLPTMLRNMTVKKTQDLEADKEQIAHCYGFAPEQPLRFGHCLVEPANHCCQVLIAFALQAY